VAQQSQSNQQVALASGDNAVVEKNREVATASLAPELSSLVDQHLQVTVNTSS